MYYIKKYLKFIITIFVCIFIVCFYFIINGIENYKDKNDTNEVVAFVETTTSVEIKDEVNNFYVDVKGEVKNPGVYFVSEGMLVIDAINLAGGLTKKACTDDINLSMKLTNEMVIYVNNKNSFTTTTKVTELNDVKIKEEKQEKYTNNGLVNINTASKEELMTLNGIGESKANSIIEYRKTNKFNTIEDIMNVSGIGEKFFEQIKNYITV
ncbi:MAG: helix-hairpin-helix domain-containing protein [Bacilli bacterium]|nr:helix-hairpin-helix domain-containing protein [Bacilli bacterium]